ncbi:hypothetical protein [Pseudomonas panipatensis]|uniref:Uncharacterized protein n=1 Tax=Pseudomonas panipatensis TaxID=428992 RepID=A0A1G8LGF4_9PSED|nr:hypothetical protein [Pseudomonas panipatensis]SDI54733.1 hypothetical protein SAMN05216272_111138 [Pseudomonas panipatensis]SMP74951.1 hypothetical protein SAMN06295951_11362 [Pseudomonas panipatensis]
MTSRTEKAWKLIRHEIERQSRSDYPSDDVAIGMIQMAYALGDIGDRQELVLTKEAATTVRLRRAELRQQKIVKLIGGTDHVHAPCHLAH